MPDPNSILVKTPDRTLTKQNRRNVWVYQQDGDKADPEQDGRANLHDMLSSRRQSTEIYNDTGTTLTANTLVSIVGWNPTEEASTVALADKDSQVFAIGYVDADIADGARGLINRAGSISGLNTTGTNLGDQVFLGAAGAAVFGRPTSGQVQVIGTVTAVDALQGTIAFDPTYIPVNDQTILQSFTPSYKYQAGSLVLHAEKIWQAKATFTSAGAFDIADWTLLTADIYDVSTIADLRAITGASQGDFIMVRGYGSDADGGEGTFQCISTSGTPGDIDSAGDDDGGWHIVASDNRVFARINEDTIRPQHFGALPAKLETDAAADSDKYATIQRVLNLWANPDNPVDPESSSSTGGWQYRTNPPSSLNCHLSSGFWRCESTVIVRYVDTFTAAQGVSEGYVAGTLRMDGRVFVPFENDDQVGIRVYASRNAGKTPCKLNAHKGRNPVPDATSSRYHYWWADQTWPNCARRTDEYRDWAASTEFYNDEMILSNGTGGDRYLYKVITPTFTSRGDSGTVAPGNTDIGSTSTNGDLTLECQGRVIVAGQDWETTLRKNRDWGIHLEQCWEHRGIRFEADGFTVGLAMQPRERSNAVGFNYITADRLHGCKIQCLVTHYVADQTVASIAERDAITGQPEGYRVLVTADGVYYVWQSSAWVNDGYTPDAGWANDDIVDLGGNFPQTFTSVNLPFPVDRSMYGLVTGAWETTTREPTKIHVFGMSLEVGSIDEAKAELVNWLSFAGSGNEVHARNDQSNKWWGFIGCDQSVQRNERNEFVTNRRGRLYANGNPAYDKNLNNGRWNRVLEIPGDEAPECRLDVPSIIDTGAFGGAEKFYSSKTCSWSYNSATPLDYLAMGAADSTTENLYHPDDDSFTFGLQWGPAFVVDLPDNFTGLARIALTIFESDPRFIDSDEANIWWRRWYVARMLDEQNNVVSAAPWSGKQSPVPFFDTIVSNYMRSSRTDSYDRTLFIVPKPFVRRLVVSLGGTRIRGYSVSVAGSRHASVYPPHAPYSQLQQGVIAVDELPEKGKYRAPYELRELTQNKTFQLPSSGVTYYAVLDDKANLSPSAGSQRFWAKSGAQGSATIEEWNGTAWDPVATNASYVLQEEWVEQGGVNISDHGDVSGAVTVDFADSPDHKMRLTGDVSLTFVNLPKDGNPVSVEFEQDGTGGHDVAVSDWDGVTQFNDSFAPLRSDPDRSTYYQFHVNGVSMSLRVGGLRGSFVGRWNYHNATSGTPATGRWQRNAGSAETSTLLYLHEDMVNGNNAALFLTGLIAGTGVTITQVGSDARGESYELSGDPVQAGDVVQLPVTNGQTFSSTIQNNRDCSFLFALN